MGWKGTLRSMGAASRQAERNAQRRQRELEKRHREFAKMEALEQAAYEVDVYENQIDLLLSVHKESSESIDWRALANRVAPGQPTFSDAHAAQARRHQSGYQPGFFARLFRRETHQRNQLQLLVDKAIAEDKHLFEQAARDWQADYDFWQEESEVAKGILQGRGQAKLDAIKLLNPFSDISHLGSFIRFSVNDAGLVQSALSVHGTRVIPAEVKSLLQSGKLSSKKMPIGKFNELLQDYVCSCALRVGRELLAALPDDLVIVTALDDVLNTATGHLEELPILSVAFSRETLDRLNMDTIDPSDAMQNFVHNMSFKKTTGFAPVLQIEPDRFRSRV